MKLQSSPFILVPFLEKPFPPCHHCLSFWRKPECFLGHSVLESLLLPGMGKQGWVLLPQPRPWQL